MFDKYVARQIIQCLQKKCNYFIQDWPLKKKNS